MNLPEKEIDLGDKKLLAGIIRDKYFTEEIGHL